VLDIQVKQELKLLMAHFTKLSRDILHQCFNLFHYQGKRFMNNWLFIDILTLRME